MSAPQPELTITVEVDHPPGWVDVLLPAGTDIDAWALAQISPSSDEAPLERVEAAAASLANAVRAVRESGTATVAALAFQPDPLEPVLALWDVDLVPFGPQLPATLAEAEQLLGLEDPTIGRLERERRELPCGPAVRVRRMRTEQADPDDPEQGSQVIEGVAYWVLPPGLDGYALVTGRWAALVLGDQLAELVDELTAHLRITVEVEGQTRRPQHT